MSGVFNVLFYTWCCGCLVWWMSYLTHGVVDVWCGECLCGGCRTIMREGGKLHIGPFGEPSGSFGEPSGPFGDPKDPVFCEDF